MQKKRILITGANGFLGVNLVNHFVEQGFDVFGSDLGEAAIDSRISYAKGDMVDRNFVSRLFSDISPAYVINTVALVDLDLCEKDMDMAYRINVVTAENVAKASKAIRARLLHISTDHLFPGDKSFYKEDSPTAPVNNYGKTKLEAENKCSWENPDTIIVRTNFYGWSHPGHKPTFGEWLYESLMQRKPIRLFTNYYFTSIEVTTLAKAIESMLRSDFRGVLNVAGVERCSKYDFGVAMAEVFGLSISSVTPVKMEPGSFAVKRQQDLSLSTDKFKRNYTMELPDVRMGLRVFKNTMPVSYKNEE